MPGRPPPGRAGRVWLAERIETARRAGELLDHKQELLRRERRRLTELADRTRREWHVSAAHADTWNVRVLVSGGRDELHRLGATGGGAASVELRWTSEAGVTYPATATLVLPPAPRRAGPYALGVAAEACRQALDAAVQHAAATTALSRVEEELVATTRRLRAIRDRLLPRLQAHLDTLDLRLDETEREEITRLRWAVPQARTETGS